MSFGCALTMSWAIAISQLRSAAPWLNHLLTAAAAEVQLLLTPRPTTGDLAMLDTRLPLVTNVDVLVGRPVYDQVSVAPIDSASPVVSVPCPTSKCVCGAESNSGSNHAGRDITGRRAEAIRTSDSSGSGYSAIGATS
jgi:hypothetical protein